MRALFLLAAMLFISALFGQVAYVQPVRATAVATFDYGAVSEIPRDECKALVALYTSSNGVNWRNQGSDHHVAGECSVGSQALPAGNAKAMSITDGFCSL